MKIVCNINQMPNELLELIKEYINKKTLVFVNKTYYNLYHTVIKNSQSIPNISLIVRKLAVETIVL